MNRYPLWRYLLIIVVLVTGIVPFVVVLYFFFQNVNRLLPPNL